MKHRSRINEEKIKICLEPGQTFQNALSNAGIHIRADCGGKGVCGKCQVKIEDQNALSSLSNAEKRFLSDGPIQEGVRLSCQVKIKENHQVAHEISLSLIEKAYESVQSESSKTKIQIMVRPQPTISRSVISPNGFSSSLTDCLNLFPIGINGSGSYFSLEVLHRLSRYFAAEKELTVVKRGDLASTILPGSRRRSLGIAVDLGTTTIAAYLCDLPSGKILVACSKANSQRKHGYDVISRIEFASKAESGLKKLQIEAIRDINELIDQSLRETEQCIDDIDDVCVVGNPTMQSIFAGISPFSIGRAPYLPVTNDSIDISNHSLGLCVRKDVNIHLFPMPSAFVGGDAVAAATAVGIPTSGESLLVVDLGTNGELILISGQGVVATSAATGPAFEGYSISCGVRAVPGAVSKIAWNARKNEFDYEIIPGNPEKRAIGLCGSAIIDAVAESRKINLIQPNGRITPDVSGLIEEDSGRAIAFKGMANDGSEVDLKLTQKDVRQIQLAKAALRVGIDALLKTTGLDAIQKTIFTGAFGASLNWENACSIGMVPKTILQGKIETIHNAAGVGAVNALLNRTYRDQARNFAKTVRCIKLESLPEFSSIFAQASELNAS